MNASRLEPSFAGVIGRTHYDSRPDWPAPKALPEGTPNVVFVVLDDVGYSDLGCFGSALRTPVMDGLAANGVRFTNFHTTPLCSPTRASLLTGRHHHSVGMRMLSNLDTGFPSGRGRVSTSAATLAEMLRPAGFSTMCAGKWHLTPGEQTSAAGPFDQWPLGRGFERYYGFIDAETDSFYPELTRDNTHVDQPRTPAEGYHLSADIVDNAITFVTDQTSITPEKPFYLHLAFGAAHAPHQAPQEFLEAQRGRFDEGWDAERARRLRRQIELGLLPEGTEAAPRNEGVRPWDELGDDERRLACALQEAYAAMVEHTDHQLGRFIEHLRELGRLDNTVLVLLSDNGASPEGGAHGCLNTTAFQNGIPEDVEENIRRIPTIGTALSQTNYPWGWAQVSNTPFKWYKQYTHEGGVRTPLIVHWPDGGFDRGGVRHQFQHVVDVLPTVLGFVGVPVPTTLGGVDQMPVHGADMAGVLRRADAPGERRTQHFEMFGHRAIWHEGWKAVARHTRGAPYEDDVWELYDTAADPTELHDLAGRHPERVAELERVFWQQAERYEVLPLDDQRFAVRAKVPHAGSPRMRRRFVYHAGMSHVPVMVAPPTMDVSHDITAVVRHREVTDDGVLVALGGVSSGYVLYLQSGHLLYEYNHVGTRYELRSDRPVPAGPSELGFRFRRTGPREGVGQLLIDGAVRDELPFPAVLPDFLGFEGLDVGKDAGSPVSTRYQGPFPFTGDLARIVFDLPEGPPGVLPERLD
ncbi:sulfatase-like hydrolase/transferase [Prauserella cavernicola]|uniref:Arylsulfatase n=1 Tax=Prauserella cavernicola TaxID=2800127 RepID=A0A934V571_9PSEU|nr:sulfatase-like hydrolase/transferase [Prauserella cavernicola]MBK1789146.1 arylsulfatase [Prauserella cavernicola]